MIISGPSRSQSVAVGNTWGIYGLIGSFHWVISYQTESNPGFVFTLFAKFQCNHGIHGENFEYYFFFVKDFNRGWVKIFIPKINLKISMPKQMFAQKLRYYTIMSEILKEKWYLSNCGEMLNIFFKLIANQLLDKASNHSHINICFLI